MELNNQEIIVSVGAIVAVVIAGLIMYRKEILFLFGKKEVPGIIVNWMSSSEKGIRYFYPIIEFEIPGREKIRFRAEERCEGAPIYEQGTEVTIKYLPSDPEFRKVVYPGN